MTTADMLRKASENRGLAKMDLEEAMRGFIVCPSEDAKTCLLGKMQEYKDAHFEWDVVQRVLSQPDVR